VTAPPDQPKIYHITHLENLRAIFAEGRLVSDRTMIERGGPEQAIGMSAIKRRRVERLEVTCHPGTRVGDYVPFYFCPRSVMLYVIHMANHPELTYWGGQQPIVHLEADLRRTVAWAEANGRRWAFSLANAGAKYATFCSCLEDLDQLDWAAIAATDFRHPDVKERKQAEFLVHDHFPVDLVERIGVHSEAVQARVEGALEQAATWPPVMVCRGWYF